MDETTGTIRLAIDSRLADVKLIGVALHRLCSLVLPPEACAEFELGVVEGVNNTIEHAYAGEEGHEVRVTVRLGEDGVQVDIADHGRPIPRHLFEKPPAMPDFDPGDIDSLPEGGMGLALIHLSADDVSYGNRDGWNVLTLYRRRAALVPTDGVPADEAWPPLLDPAKLDSLRLAIGDDAFHQMVGFLPGEIEKNLEVIRKALDADDVTQARGGAHKLRGQVGMFGARRIEAIGRAMEVEAVDLAAVRALLPALAQAIKDSVDALAAETESNRH